MFCQSMIAFTCAWVVAHQTPTDPFTIELQAYQQERAESAKHFTDSALQSADRLIERARAAHSQGADVFARELVRNARWHLPYLPLGMPPNVERILGQGRFRHSDRVNAIAFRADGRRLVTTSRDGTAKVWNLDNGREIVSYDEHKGDSPDEEQTNVFGVPAAAYSPDGTIIATSGSRDIHLWEAETGKRLKTLEGHEQLCRGLAFTPDGKRLLSGSDDRSLILWDVATGENLAHFPNQEQGIESIAINPSGVSFATLNRAGLLQIYPLENKISEPIFKLSAMQPTAAGFTLSYLDEHQLLFTDGNSRITLQEVPKDKDDKVSAKAIRVYDGHSSKINILATVPGSKQLLSGGDDSTVRLWDAESGKTEHIFELQQDTVTALAMAPDGTFAVSGAEDGQMRILHLNPVDESRVNDEATAELWSIAVSPNEKLYATAGADRLIRVYDAATGTLNQTLTGHTFAVTALKFLDDRQLASTSGDKLLKIWDLTTGKAIDCVGHTAAVLTVATTPDAQTLVTGSFDRTLRGWEPKTGKLLWTWQGDSAICSVALSQDGRTAYVGSADGQLSQVDLVAGEKPTLNFAVSAHRHGVAEIVLAPDGFQLATCGGDGNVGLWDCRGRWTIEKLTTIEPKRTEDAKPQPFSTVDFSPSGKYLTFAGADSNLYVWDPIKLNEVRTFRGDDGWITSARFGKTSDELYSVSTDKSVRRYEFSFETARSNLGHSMAVNSIAISPDHRHLATASADRTIKIWDLKPGTAITGTVAQTLIGSQDEVAVIQFLDNDHLASNSADGKIRIWSLKSGEIIRTAPTGKAFVMGVTPDGKQVSAIYNVENPLGTFTVYIDTFQTSDLKLEEIVEKNRKAVCGTFSPDMSLALTGDGDGTIRIWDVATRKQVGGDWSLFDQKSGDVAFTPDNKTLVGMDTSGSIKIANIAERSAKEAFPAFSDDQERVIVGIMISPDGKRFCTFFQSGELVLWSIEGKRLRDWKLPGELSSLAFIPETNSIATGSMDGTVLILNAPPENENSKEK